MGPAGIGAYPNPLATTGADPVAIPDDCWTACYSYWANGQSCPDPCAVGFESPSIADQDTQAVRQFLSGIKFPSLTTVVVIGAVLVFAGGFGKGLAARL
jgi:hypothetical protein